MDVQFDVELDPAALGAEPAVPTSCSIPPWDTDLDLEGLSGGSQRFVVIGCATEGCATWAEFAAIWMSTQGPA